jgi:predicted DNA-binding transcriptional regulator AlpA
VTDQFIPPWMDMATLCRHISGSPTMVEAWVAKGFLPPPRKRGAKLMWKWSEVDEWLTLGKPAGSTETDEERIRNGTRREAAAAR